MHRASACYNLSDAMLKETSNASTVVSHMGKIRFVQVRKRDKVGGGGGGRGGEGWTGDHVNKEKVDM
jgi:hypothetical protein